MALIRNIICVTFVMFIVSSIWVLAWARSVEDRVRESDWQPRAGEQSEVQPAARPIARPDLVTSTHDLRDL
jgi:hypothetical protein